MPWHRRAEGAGDRSEPLDDKEQVNDVESHRPTRGIADPRCRVDAPMTACAHVDAFLDSTTRSYQLHSACADTS